MKQLRNLLKVNPIIVKEIRSRMRGPRAFITLTIILLGMGGVMFGILQIILANSRYTNVLSAQVGQNMFAALVFLELFMISVVTPAVTSGAISSEKERETYDMLMATPLSPASILWGKLISALSYVFLLLFAAVPLASVVFIFGGVAPREMIKALLVLLVVAVTFGILGIFMSALFGRTGRATIASFIIVLLLTLGPLFLTILVAALRQGEPPRWLLSPSPISALSSAITPSTGSVGGGNEIFYILGGFFNLGVGGISQTQIPRPLYHYSLPVYAVLSLILYMLATRLVQPTRRWRIHRKEWIVALVILLSFIGLVVAAFLLTAKRYEWVLTGQSNPAINRAAVPVPVAAVERPVQVEARLAGQEAEATLSPATAAAMRLSADERAEIYAAVARQLYTVDHTVGDIPPNWSVLYLITVTDDRVGDPNTPTNDPLLLEEAILDGVAARLEDLPASVIWIENRETVTLDPRTGAVDNGQGAIITFGNIHPFEGGSPSEEGAVQVPASLYFAHAGATGKTYILMLVDGAWQVTGTTGVEWIS